MAEFEPDRFSEADSQAEFARLFPQGFASRDVLEEIAPEGWEHSPLRAVFHPTLQQVYTETLRFHQNLQNLRPPDDQRLMSPQPTLNEVARDFHEEPIEPKREVSELVGKCLWDVFSDNHDVIARDRRVFDLGSFRGAGGFLAELLNRQTGEERYDYIDFYLGTIWISERADLTPVYRMIFRRLQSRAFDWVYQFPRLHIVDLRPLRDALKQGEEPDWLNYSPTAALALAEEERDRDRQIAELRESLEEGHREAVEEALKGPPPKTVLAYREVYGRWPRGWPPVEPD
jgi:hypothetical protein